MACIYNGVEAAANCQNLHALLSQIAQLQPLPALNIRPTMAPAPTYSSQPHQAPQLVYKPGVKDTSQTTSGTYDCKEDYNGDYRFAPIEEAQVSRAMIKRCAGFSPHLLLAA